MDGFLFFLVRFLASIGNILDRVEAKSRANQSRIMDIIVWQDL